MVETALALVALCSEVPYLLGYYFEHLRAGEASSATLLLVMSTTGFLSTIVFGLMASFALMKFQEQGVSQGEYCDGKAKSATVCEDLEKGERSAEGSINGTVGDGMMEMRVDVESRKA